MKDKIKELIKSGEHEELIIKALCACESICGDFAEEEVKRETCSIRNAFEVGCNLKQALTPKKKPVDMSVLAGSPFDCVFWTSEETNKLIGEYCRPYKGDYFIAGHGTFKYCKPRMNYPFSFALFGGRDNALTFIFEKLHPQFELRVIDDCAFEITGLRDGFCWPWECE